MVCLSDIVGILDMDGFLISKRSYCKELRLMRAGDTTARSGFFRHWRAVGQVICERQEDMRVL